MMLRAMRKGHDSLPHRHAAIPFKTAHQHPRAIMRCDVEGACSHSRGRRPDACGGQAAYVMVSGHATD